MFYLGLAPTKVGLGGKRKGLANIFLGSETSQ
jgi:hypothetical protein